jgi:hypothetical protein
MSTHHTRGVSALFTAMLAFGELAAWGSAACAGDQAVCVTANVPEAFTLPDGRVHAAGRLKLCLDRLLNPAVGLHRVSEDGDGTALVMSRRSPASEYKDGPPVLVFHRAAGMVLDLVGYVVPLDHKAWKYTLTHSNGIGRFSSAAHAAEPSDRKLVLLIASNLN